MQKETKEMNGDNKEGKREKARHWSVLLMALVLIGFMIGVGVGENTENGEAGAQVYYAGEVDTGSKVKTSTKTGTKTSKTSKKESKSSQGSKTKEKEAVSEDGEVEEVVEAEDSESLERSGEGNTAGNILNHGVLCAGENSLYYVNSADKNRLYEEKDGETRMVLDAPVEFINYCNGKIYVKIVNKTGVIGIMDEETGNYEQRNLGWESMSAEPGKLIGADKNRIYEINEKGESTKVLYENEIGISDSTLYDGEIYFINKETGKSICRLTEEGEAEEISCGGVESYTIGEDGLYASAGGKLYYGGDWEEPVCSLRASCMNEEDGILYYADMEDGGKAYEMDLSNGEKRKLTEEKVDGICIASGKIAVLQGDTVSFL